MDASTATPLQEIVRRESLSLLAYVRDAYPWTSRVGDPALARLRQLVGEHERALGTLVRLLARNRVPPPFTGSFPTGFTTVNFLALSHVLPRLVESERRSLALLEAEAPRVSGEEPRAAVAQFLAAKRDHLARLEALNAPAPASAPAPAAS